VHGDPHLRNVLVSTTGSISALLDWELSTIGDPLADLGQALVYWQRDDDDLTPIGPMASSVPGMVDRRGLIDRYAATSGVRPERLDWYVAFATWKLAAVLNGVHARERAGAYGPVVSRPTEEADMPQRLAARALRLATELH
jgi:aminoglycoside phosphotransferase (APT) family kinase protein